MTSSIDKERRSRTDTKMVDVEYSTNARKFAEDIENIVWMKDIKYMEAVLEWCEEKGFDETTAGDFVKKNPAILAKIQEEAESLHFLPQTSRLF